MTTSKAVTTFLLILLSSLAAQVSAQTISVLHSFANTPDGAEPVCKLVVGYNGNIFGVTYGGGKNGEGTIFRINNQVEGITILHNFGAGQSDGQFPVDNTGLIRDQVGNLYGTTSAGGGGTGPGTVFKLDNVTDKLTILHSFSGTDGKQPHAGLSMDALGNLYGTTNEGGNANLGTVFEITASGEFSTLYSFKSRTDGYEPNGGVILDEGGNLYGATRFGGDAGYGTIYKLDTAGNHTILYNFTGGDDGQNIYGGLIRDSSGNLYGASATGGTFGYGNVFKFDTNGQLIVLYSFTDGIDRDDGAYPFTELVMDASGNLYGTTEGGGGIYGTVFEISPSGVETSLYLFTNTHNGGLPVAGVTMDSTGNLYGTTPDGGESGYGVVFELTP